MEWPNLGALCIASSVRRGALTAQQMRTDCWILGCKSSRRGGMRSFQHGVWSAARNRMFNSVRRQRRRGPLPVRACHAELIERSSFSFPFRRSPWQHQIIGLLFRHGNIKLLDSYSVMALSNYQTPISARTHQIIRLLFRREHVKLLDPYLDAWRDQN